MIGSRLPYIIWPQKKEKGFSCQTLGTPPTCRITQSDIDKLQSGVCAIYNVQEAIKIWILISSLGIFITLPIFSQHITVQYGKKNKNFFHWICPKRFDFHISLYGTFYVPNIMSFHILNNCTFFSCMEAIMNEVTICAFSGKLYSEHNYIQAHNLTGAEFLDKCINEH